MDSDPRCYICDAIFTIFDTSQLRVTAFAILAMFKSFIQHLALLRVFSLFSVLASAATSVPSTESSHRIFQLLGILRTSVLHPIADSEKVYHLYMRVEAANLFSEAGDAALQAAHLPPLHHHLLVRAQQLRLAVVHLHVELRLVAANNQSRMSKDKVGLLQELSSFTVQWSVMPGL